MLVPRYLEERRGEVGKRRRLQTKLALKDCRGGVGATNQSALTQKKSAETGPKTSQIHTEIKLNLVSIIIIIMKLAGSGNRHMKT